MQSQLSFLKRAVISDSGIHTHNPARLQLPAKSQIKVFLGYRGPLIYNILSSKNVGPFKLTSINRELPAYYSFAKNIENRITPLRKAVQLSVQPRKASLYLLKRYSHRSSNSSWLSKNSGRGKVLACSTYRLQSILSLWNCVTAPV